MDFIGYLLCWTYCCIAPHSGWLYFACLCLLHLQLQRRLALAVRKWCNFICKYLTCNNSSAIQVKYYATQIRLTKLTKQFLWRNISCCIIYTESRMRSDRILSPVGSDQVCTAIRQQTLKCISNPNKHAFSRLARMPQNAALNTCLIDTNQCTDSASAL